MSDGTERHRQDAVDGIEYSIYTYEMSNVGYVNIKVALFKVASDPVTSRLSMNGFCNSKKHTLENI